MPFPYAFSYVFVYAFLYVLSVRLFHTSFVVSTQEISCVYTRDLLCMHNTLVHAQEPGLGHKKGAVQGLGPGPRATDHDLDLDHDLDHDHGLDLDLDHALDHDEDDDVDSRGV